MSIESLVDALIDALRARQEYRDARDRYDGPDWGYHGWALSEEAREATEALKREFDAAVDDRVREVLAERLAQIPSNSDA